MQEFLVEINLKEGRMPAKYAISDELFAQGVKEYAKQWGSDAEHVFRTTLTLVCQAHERERVKPGMKKPELQPIPGMEDLRQKMLADFEAADKMIRECHREGLIRLLTMENGLSRETAEKIVDIHILIH